MRFTILTAALLGSAIGVSGLPALGLETSILSKRAAFCTTNKMEESIVVSSASAADCLILSSSSLPEQPWSPTEANGYAFEATHGSCGFRAQFRANNGSLDASQVVIDGAQFGNVIDIAIERYAGEKGMVGATGNIICLAAGMVTKVGWVEFEVYGAV